MKNKIAIYLLLAMIALTAFSGISSSLIAGTVRKSKADETTLHIDPEPVKVVYLRNPNIETLPTIEDAAITEPETIPETVAKTEAETEPVIEWSPDPNDVAIVAQVIYAEARGLSDTEKAAVAWCILNRVDDPRFPDTVREVVTSPCQFAFSWDTPVLPELCRLADDVLCRHHAEKSGEGNVGRVLPSEYCFFWGDGRHNFFRIGERDQVYWDWSLESPYEKEN